MFYGGAAGGGKSYALCMDAARWLNVPSYTAVIFRRTSVQITQGGGLWAKSQEIFQPLGGHSREGAQLDWTWPSGASIQFRHLQHEKDRLAHQGAEYCFIGFDELTHFTEAQFWYLLSRNRSTCGVKPYLRATCNAEPGWVADFIDWWIGPDGYVIPERCGIIRYFARADDETVIWADRPEDLPPLADGTPRPSNSFTFIAADLADNRLLEEADPGYRARLLSLPRLERERLLGRAGKKGGNWRIKESAGLYFRRDWFARVERPTDDIVTWCRGWDLAASAVTKDSPDPDWSVGVRVGRYANGRFVIDGRSISRLRGSPHQVEAAMRRAAEQDGIATLIGLWQDPGSAGKSDLEHKMRLLCDRTVQTEVARKDKTVYWGPVSSAAEQGRIDILGEGPHLEAFLSVLEDVPEGHDDDADALARAYMVVANPPTHAYASAKTEKAWVDNAYEDDWDE